MTSATEQCKAVHDVIAIIQANTKASFERGRTRVKEERAAVKRLLTMMRGQPPTEAEIDLTLSEIWPAKG